MKIAKVVLIIMLVFGLILVNLFGCGSNKDDDENSQMPAIPPDSSMSMDLSAFGGGKLAPLAPLPGKNFRNAAARVLLMDTAIIITLAPSVTVFKAAKNSNPVKQEDGSWLWTYTIAYLGNIYKAELNGRVEGNKNLWSMKITCQTIQPPLEGFEWYTGECTKNNTSGTWQFFDYKAPTEKKEVGTIEWKVTSLDKGNIVFTSKNPKSDIFGDILTYSLEGTTASVSYFDSSENVTADIIWDIITSAGSIKVPGYNSGEIAYWDENKQDVVK